MDKMPSFLHSIVCQLVVKYPVVASDFFKELVEELRCARATARKNMQ